MSIQSMTDVAFQLMGKKKKAVSFQKLWEEVCQMMGYNEAQKMKKMSLFYTDLTLDGRFASLKDNKWDLKSRLTFNEVYVDTSSLVIDEIDNEDEFEDEEVEEEYEKNSNDR